MILSDTSCINLYIISVLDETHDNIIKAFNAGDIETIEMTDPMTLFTKNINEVIGDFTQLSLAKYEMVNHPRDPMRLTKISSLLTTLETLASTPTMVSLLFQGNIGVVTQIINGIFLFQ